ncbi:hypothetical protein [Marivirga harenae]|uniref:hypothetical protein n=1 Tax=Marivirga harenae TaxID=2010992 RepID=UPI0026E0B111|nr:hypothetical protein [Marivirga harenae]WKV12666.1 hypothetical protein Q3Y49_02330 [Marivirga harenae]
MKKKAVLSFCLSLVFTLLSTSVVIGQTRTEMIGSIDDKVSLKRDGDQYLLTYRNNNLNSDKADNQLTIKDKETLDNLYTFIIEGFDSMNPGPVQFEMDKNELRLYYNKKFLGKDLVEIIHENKETEETGTIYRLSQKDVQELFGKS